MQDIKKKICLFGLTVLVVSHISAQSIVHDPINNIPILSNWLTAIDTLYANYDMIMNTITQIENQYRAINQAIENAKINAELNSITNAEFFCGDAYDGAKELAKRGIIPDVVVLDPPRKGCQAELFDVISAMNPSRIVYVSCDAATLARDLKILAERGYKTVEVTPVDMFPRTPHVEAVAVIKRN